MKRVLLAAAIALAAGCSHESQTPPPQADSGNELQREIDRLASEDATERDAASAALAAAGAPAVAAMTARLVTEKDPEVCGRLRAALQHAELQSFALRRWKSVWSSQPMRSASWNVMISPDEKLLATVSNDGTLMLLDVGERRLVWRREGLRVISDTALCFSADSKLIVAATETFGAESSIKAWRTATGEEVGPIEEATQFDYRGVDRMSCGPGNVRVLWQPRQDNCPATLDWVADDSGVSPGSTAEFGDHLSSDGKLLCVRNSRNMKPATIPYGQFVEVFDATSGKRLRDVEIAVEHAFCYSPDGRSAAGAHGGRIRIEPLDGEGKALEWDAGAVAMCWTAEGLVTARDDGTVEWWEGGSCVRRIETGLQHPCQIDAAGGLLVIDVHTVKAGKVGTYVEVLMDAASGEILKRRDDHWTLYDQIDSGFLLKIDGQLQVWRDGGRFRADVFTPDEHDWSWPYRYGRSLYVHREGEEAIVETYGAKGQRWTLPPHGAPIERLDWTPWGLVAIGDNVGVVLDPADGHALRTAEKDHFFRRKNRLLDTDGFGLLSPPHCLGISGDGRSIAVRTAESIEVRGVGSTQPREFAHDDPTQATTLSPVALDAEGRRLAGALTDHAIDLWDVTSGERLRRITVDPPGCIMELDFVGDAIVAQLDRPVGRALVGFDSSGKLLFERPWSEESGNNQLRVGDVAVAMLGSHRDATWLDVANVLHPDRSGRIFLGGFLPQSDVDVQLSADGSCALVGDGFSQRLVDVASGTERQIPERSSRVEGVLGFLEGRHPLVLGEDGLERLFGPTGASAGVDRAIRGQALAVSPDGRRIAVAFGGKVTVYELR